MQSLGTAAFCDLYWGCISSCCYCISSTVASVSVDPQMLTVHLEETDCFAAWVSAREVGIGQPSVESSDTKCMFCFRCLSVVDSVSAFRVKLGANDLNCVGVPLNPTHSLTLSCSQRQANCHIVEHH